uniref:Glucagon like peptide 2 receptor n=1 Tax=Cynoglossus semilaevis TaxID=244447 RepID=A0A3P8UNP0_CYNSE
SSACLTLDIKLNTHTYIQFVQTSTSTLNFFTSFLGNFCRGTFDSFVCWPHSSPGNVSVPCPPYLPWIKEGKVVTYRQCLENGRWRPKENLSEPWRDDSECQEDQTFQGPFNTKLHCTRNYIHMNLFVSFILRAVAVISKEIVLHVMYTHLPTDDSGWNSYSSSALIFISFSQTAVMCKLSKVCMEYFVACNYFWLLVEAIFLHALLFTTVPTRRRLLKKFMLLGWGTPVIFVTPWMLVKILYENTECWSIVNRWFWWIIRGPITLSVLVIFFIFIKILMLLLSKLRADQVKFTDYRYSLARSTLLLIPLLGIHEVVFTVLIDECVDDSGRYVRNFFNLTLSSFQGFLVAILYCFANGEVSFTSSTNNFDKQLLVHLNCDSSYFRSRLTAGTTSALDVILTDTPLYLRKVNKRHKPINFPNHSMYTVSNAFNIISNILEDNIQICFPNFKIDSRPYYRLPENTETQNH